MGKLRIGILSSVKPRCFESVLNDNRFNDVEKYYATLSEQEVWRKNLKIKTLRENIEFKVFYTLEQLPKKGEFDGYILGGSPHMVTSKEEWMIKLQKFIYDEINSGKSVLGVCFGHQIMSNAFGGKVEYLDKRELGTREVYLNKDGLKDEIFSQMRSHFKSIWSHKQYVSNAGEGVALGDNSVSPNQIIRYGDNSYGVQFHPEFSREFATFLVKFLSSDLKKENLNEDKILKKLNNLSQNESSKIIELFLESFR
ncbi:type 1 glutamine amidotransferase [Candidatus Gracilibacteria bacterium]|nr:type 1 glutamine amidotransferase [Candidatus Gracilibacteria bacterium]